MAVTDVPELEAATAVTETMTAGRASTAEAKRIAIRGARIRSGYLSGTSSARFIKVRGHFARPGDPLLAFLRPTPALLPRSIERSECQLLPSRSFRQLP